MSEPESVEPVSSNAVNIFVGATTSFFGICPIKTPSGLLPIMNDTIAAWSAASPSAEVPVLLCAAPVATVWSVANRLLPSGPTSVKPPEITPHASPTSFRVFAIPNWPTNFAIAIRSRKRYVRLEISAESCDSLIV